MTEAFPSGRPSENFFWMRSTASAKRCVLLVHAVKSWERWRPMRWDALVRTGMFRLKLAAEMGGAEADPVTEMLVLEGLAYHDLTSGWCTMVGATAIASLGTFLPPAGLEKVFTNGSIPTAAIPFFPAGRAVRDGDGYRVNARWRFNSGIRHAEWVLGGTVVEGTEAENGGRPIVMFSAFPIKDVTIHYNWGGVVRVELSSRVTHNGRARPMPVAHGIRDGALDDAREPTDRRHMMSLAMHDKRPVKLPPVEGSDVHAARLSLHEHGSEGDRLSDQPASDELHTKPRVLRLERDLRSEAAFADGAIDDAAHGVRTTGKSKWKFHDILDPHGCVRSRQVRAAHQHERLAHQQLGDD
jgi:hypothetical protein